MSEHVKNMSNDISSRGIYDFWQSLPVVPGQAGGGSFKEKSLQVKERICL